MSSAAAHKPLSGSIDGLELGTVMPPSSDVQHVPAWTEGLVRSSQQRQQESTAKAAVDLTAGTVAGIAQLLVGHPFDTIKVCGAHPADSRLLAQPRAAEHIGRGVKFRLWQVCGNQAGMPVSLHCHSCRSSYKVKVELQVLPCTKAP